MSNYQVSTFKDQFTIYELLEESTHSWVRICPERGGIVLSYGVRGQEQLYLDKETFYDPQANIRGGIPILFPICGHLPEGQYEWEHKHFQMNSHGLARIYPWEVVKMETEGQASLTLKLRSLPDMLVAFPFEFELIFTYVLSQGALRISQEYHNLTDRDMPMYAGFHPYFATENKTLVYETDAAKYLDCNDEAEKPTLGSIDLSETVKSLILLDAKQPQIAFQFPPSAVGTIRMTYDPIFKYMVLWSIPGEPFVCVEPWMAMPNAINLKQGLTYVRPHAALHSELTISCD
jgi:galactose mutarotase-like enzyme